MQMKYQKWVRWIETICADVGNLCQQKHIFLEVKAIIDENPNIHHESAFYELFDNGYTAIGVMGVRRQVKTQKDSISLAHLLNDIQNNPHIISLQRYKLLYRESGVGEDLAETHFKEFKASDTDYIDPAIVERDLSALRNSVQVCETFANRRLAHSDPRTVEPHPTFSDLHSCIDLIEGLAIKYWLILTGNNLNSLFPKDLGNWKAVFRVPWIENRT